MLAAFVSESTGEDGEKQTVIQREKTGLIGNYSANEAGNTIEVIVKNRSKLL